jgi:hypothetical protein
MNNLINSEVKILGEKQTIINNVSELLSCLYNDIYQYLKSLDIESSKDVLKMLPAGLILIDHDLITHFSGNKNNTQIMPFKLVNEGVENARTMQVYLPAIIDTLKNGKPTKNTEIIVANLALAGVFFACKIKGDKNLDQDIRKTLRYNAAGMMSREFKNLFKWAGVTVNKYGLITSIESKELKAIMAKNSAAVRAVAGLKMSTTYAKKPTYIVDDLGQKIQVDASGEIVLDDEGKPKTAPPPKTIQLYCSIQCTTVTIGKAKHTYSRQAYLDDNQVAGMCGKCGVAINAQNDRTPAVKLKEWAEKEAASNAASIAASSDQLPIEEAAEQLIAGIEKPAKPAAKPAAKKAVKKTAKAIKK